MLAGVGECVGCLDRVTHALKTKSVSHHSRDIERFQEELWVSC
jgi:hypothetical protein